MSPSALHPARTVPLSPCPSRDSGYEVAGRIRTSSLLIPRPPRRPTLLFQVVLIGCPCRCEASGPEPVLASLSPEPAVSALLFAVVSTPLRPWAFPWLSEAWLWGRSSPSGTGRSGGTRYSASIPAVQVGPWRGSTSSWSGQSRGSSVGRTTWSSSVSLGPQAFYSLTQGPALSTAIDKRQHTHI